MTFYVEVSEHATQIDPVPFTHLRLQVPGCFEVGRIYGPFTARGAERVARRALAEVSDTVTTLPSGYRFATDANGTRVVKIHSRLPGHWTRPTARNMPVVRVPRITITTITRTFAAWAEGDDEPMHLDTDTTSEMVEASEGESIAQAVARVIRDAGAWHASSSPRVNARDWYSAETTSDVVTGELTEVSLHMSGSDWTDALARNVHTLVTD